MLFVAVKKQDSTRKKPYTSCSSFSSSSLLLLLLIVLIRILLCSPRWLETCYVIQVALNSQQFHLPQPPKHEHILPHMDFSLCLRENFSVVLLAGLKSFLYFKCGDYRHVSHPLYSCFSPVERSRPGALAPPLTPVLRLWQEGLH